MQVACVQSVVADDGGNYMSTRSAIVIEKEGQYEGVYCHFDGYPEGVGLALVHYYSDLERIYKLVSNGDISYLRPRIGKKHSFNDVFKSATTFYHRDRGDDWSTVKPYRSSSYRKLAGHFGKRWINYLYIFRNGEWFVDSELLAGDRPRKLSEVLRERLGPDVDLEPE